jgi:hypothetical protein
VRAWRSPAIYVDVPSSDKWEQAEKEERVVLADGLAPWRKWYPEVDVVERTVLGNPGGVLVDASAEAELLVVGSHGRGGIGGPLLGSVSHAALHHARCPGGRSAGSGRRRLGRADVRPGRRRQPARGHTPGCARRSAPAARR